MKLSELFEHLRIVYLDQVSNLIDGPTDDLYGPDTLARLFHQAQEDMAKRTFVLVNDDVASYGSPATELCTVALTGRTNYRNVAINPKIIAVYRVALSDSDVPLKRSHTRFINVQPDSITPEPSYWDVNQTYTQTAGRPSRYATDMELGRIEFDRPLDATTAALSLRLSVAHLPLVTLAASDLNAEPEVPAEEHLTLCEFVAGKLLSNPNLDTEVRRYGATFTQNWEAAIRRLSNRRRDRERGPGGWVFGRWGNR